MKDKQSHIIAAIGTIIVLLLLFLLLWFVTVGVPQNNEDEGIEMAFGEEDLGGGNNPQPVASIPEETTAPSRPATPSRNDLMTQEDPNSVALQKEAEEKRKKEAAERAEQQRLKREQEARERAEREAEERRIAEQKAKEQQAIDNANKLAGLFGQNTTPSEGSGATIGNSTAGNPIGKGSSGGVGWSLAGRQLQGSLSKPKLSQGTQEGTVIVTIRVDANGKVVDAKATGGTISEKAVQRACEAEAMKAKFTGGQSEVSGTITYKITL